MKFLPNLHPVISSQKIDLVKLTKDGVLKKAKQSATKLPELNLEQQNSELVPNLQILPSQFANNEMTREELH